MKDLTITYHGDPDTVAYDNIYDFIHMAEAGKQDSPTMDTRIDRWELFENPLNSGTDTTVRELLAHLHAILAP